MAEVATYNNYSEELLEELKKARPKKGQVIYFEVLNKTKLKNGRIVFPNSIKIPSTDTIWDEGKQELIDIGYFKDRAYTIPNPIEFIGRDLGRIACRHNDVAKFDFLYLNRKNKSNKGKSWNNEGSGGSGYLYRMVEPAKTAQEKIDFRRKRRVAEEVVDKFPDSVLRSYAVALNMKGINEFSDNLEIRNNLLDIAEKNPDVILKFDKDYEKKFAIFVRKLEEKGIIANTSGKWVWMHDDKTIVTHKVGGDKNKALMDFLSEHPETKKLMEDMLNKEALNV